MKVNKLLLMYLNYSMEANNEDYFKVQVYKYIPTQQVESKNVEGNNNPQSIKEEIPKLKPAEKRRVSKVSDDK